MTYKGILRNTQKYARDHFLDQCTAAPIPDPEPEK